MIWSSLTENARDLLEMNEIVWFVVIGIAAICGFLYWRIQQQAKALQALEERLHSVQQHLEEEVRMASRGAFGVGKRLIETEKRLNVAVDRQLQMENMQAAESQSRQARRIIQKTTTEEEPTRNEAKLAAMLKGEAEEGFP